MVVASRNGFSQGNPHSKGAAFAGRALDFHSPGVRLDNEFDDAQAQATTTAWPGETLIDLIETIEDLTRFGWSQANAIVLHLKADMLAIRRDARGDAPIVR